MTRNFVMEQKPDVILDVVDATNIERNLYLTLQLAELGAAMVVALNMMDMLKSRGVSIDVQKLEHLLGLPVVPISASRGRGIRNWKNGRITTGVERRAGSPPLSMSSGWRNVSNAVTAAAPHMPSASTTGGNIMGGIPLTYMIDEFYATPVLEAILRIEDIIAHLHAQGDGPALVGGEDHR